MACPSSRCLPAAYRFTKNGDGDPEVCGDPLLPPSFNPDNACAACKDSYLGREDWLECKICEHWFHERYSMA